MSDYQNGYQAGQQSVPNMAGWNDSNKVPVDDYNRLIGERNKLVADYNELLETSDYVTALRQATRDVSIRSESGTQLLAPPHDHGAESRINYNVLMQLKKENKPINRYTAETAFDALMSSLTEAGDLEMYGLK